MNDRFERAPAEGTAGSFDTTLPYDDDPRWAARARVVSPARARQDIDPSRSQVRPGPAHVAAALRSLRSGRTVVLYSACRGNLELLALVIARLCFRSRVGTVLFTGDMWEPGTGLRLAASRAVLRLVDAIVTRWVVHTEADVECFVEVWGIDRAKIDIAPFGFTPDWDRYPPLRRADPYVFAGGNSHRCFAPLLEAARRLPDVRFVMATDTVGADECPPNVALVPVDRPHYQAALTGAAAVVVPLRPDLLRSVGQQTYLNAMRAGRVTIVPRSAGVDEYLDSGWNGLVVDGSPEGYVDAVRAVTDPAAAARNEAMGERAQATAEKHSFDVHPTRILEILDRLVDEETDRSAIAPGSPDLGTVRVAMLLQSYLPVVGGAQRQLAQLLPRFPALAIGATTIARGVEGAPARETVEGGEIVRLTVEGSGAARSIGYTVGALRELARRRPDVIHAYDLLSPTTTAMAAKLLWRIPIVVKVLRGGQLGDLERLRVKPFGSLRLRLMRRLIDRVVVISDEIEDELTGVGFHRGQLVRIHNGVDVERFSPATADERRELRAGLRLGDGPLVIYTGRLAAEKRVDLLIEQWPAIRARCPGATLLVVGDGPERIRLVAAAAEGVCFIGRVDDVTPYLRASDVFVLPSDTEGLSNSLLEAMSAGLAVVSTKVGGADDVIEHYGSGVLIPPSDADSLRESIVELLTDEPLRTALATGARRAMVDGFSLAATARKLASLYDDLATERNR